MKKNLWLVRPIVMAVGSCFGIAPSWSNPTGPQVMHGNVQIQGLGTNNLKVTNSPSSIIHWQGFSIGAGQVTQFAQQSASSAVLNRVVGADISQIHGQLLSNGRVFLINPAGILIGAGGVVDTAGFVGSTLNMLNADFLAGKLKFDGDASAGSIVNQGWIRTGYGGNIVLVAPNIENSGLIHAPGGELVLAAGQKMTIGSLALEGVQFEIQAPADSVLNVGKLLADGGAVGVFAGTLKHTGDIRANALVRDEAGRIVLKAQTDITATAGSTISANGKSGGDILVQSGTGHTRLAGQVTAEGRAGRGGDIKLLGNRVSLTEHALVDASGTGAGGQIRIGGDYLGANPGIANATRTFIGPDALLRADSRNTGDGGRIIVWADKSTQYYGSLSARGGPGGGNGGFSEVSGKESLIFVGNADLGAANGLAGNLLLDPLDLYADNRGGFNPALINDATDVPTNAVTISPTTLTNLNANVKLFASRYMRIGNDITLNAGLSFSAEVGTYTPLFQLPGDPAAMPPVLPSVPEGTPPNQLDLAANITTMGGAVTLLAPRIQTVANSTISTGGGAINLTAASTATSIFRDVAAGALTLASGGGAVTATANNGAITLGGIDTGGNALTVTASGFVNLSTNAGEAVQTGGGAVTLKSTASSVQTRSILAAGGPVEIEGNGVTTTPAASVIDTTGTVKLTARAGNVDVRVNNSSGVTASAKSATTNVSVNIDSTGILNVASATAETTACPFFSSCAGATVILESTGGNVTVGTATAKAPIFNPGGSNENVSESVTIRTLGAGNSVLAMSGSQVKATDVTLTTDPLSGGGIGSAATALNVDVKRTFTFTPNGPFKVALDGGPGPNRLVMNIGVMPMGGIYNNSTVTGSGVAMDVSANATTVTVNNLTLTDVAGGFSSVVVRQPPKLDLFIPNGALVATNVEVPQGGGTQNSVSGAFPVDLRAQGPNTNGNLTLTQFKRQGAANPSSLTLRSNNGKITLGKIEAAMDSINAQTLGTVTNAGDIDFLAGTAGSITTGGNVFLQSTDANLVVGPIDTASGGGAGTVTLRAPSLAGAMSGNIFARDAGGALEVSAGGAVTVFGQLLGDPAGNALNLAGPQISLTTSNARGRVGAAGNALTANTPDLTIDTSLGQAAAFNIDTGSVNLKNLFITTPLPGGMVRINGDLYDFREAAPGVINVFEPTPSGISSTHFDGGHLSVTTTSGDISLGPINLGTGQATPGKLTVVAKEGSISGGNPLDAKEVTLGARNATPTTAGVGDINVGAIGATVRPDSVTITAGFRGNAFFANTREGSVTTGAITPTMGGSVTITSTGNTGELTIGSVGTPAPIGSAAIPAGTVNLTADRNPNLFGDDSTGTITAGNIFAQTINLRAGSQDGGDGIQVGALEAPTITINRTDSNSGDPRVTVDAIGAVRPVESLNIGNSQAMVITNGITGNPMTANTVNITASRIQIGAAVNAPGPVSTVNLNADSGALTLGPGGIADITAGDGSTITLNHTPGTAVPLTFSRINAGPMGTVSITTNALSTGIRQTAGTGLTAQNVTFTTDTGDITRTDGDNRVALNSVKALVISSAGNIALNGSGGVLDSFVFTRGGTGTQTFDLFNLGGQTISITNTAAPTVVATSATPLDFTLNNSPGGMTLGTGIVTTGGTVTLTAAGPLDASAGINTTGAPAMNTRGSVTLRTTANSSPITTGAITTPPTASTGGEIPRAINIIANGTSSGIVVGGDLYTGTNGGPIELSVADGDITRTGMATIRSESANSVFVSTADGNIGASGTPLLVDSPNVRLTALNAAAITEGNVFATLTNTTASTTIDLDLTAHNGFNVAAMGKPFGVLAVTTRGTGAGALTLTAPGQTYTFNRTPTDLFTMAPLANTLEVVEATGTPMLTSATFRAVDGDLLVKGKAGGVAPIAATNLTLEAQTRTGNLKLQGNSATPLTLTNTGNQEFLAGANVEITNKATLAGGTQTIGSSEGNVTLTGGTLANESVSVSATARQRIFTSQNAGGNIVFQAGNGDAASVTASFNGPVNPGVDTNNAEQQIEARGQVQLRGGDGTSTGSFALVTGNQRQLIRAGNNVGAGTVLLHGGSGTNATAQIVNTGAVKQQVGESRTFAFNNPFPYSTVDVTLEGGAGSGSSASVIGNGEQVVQSRFGTIALNVNAGPGPTVNVGTGANAFASIESTATAQQSVGGSASNLILAAGTGSGSYARIRSTSGFQSINASNAITLTANATGASSATITGVGQSIFGNADLTLTAAAASGAEARIESSAGQTLNVGDLTLIASGASAQILAQGIQSVSAGTTMLNAGTAANSVALISTDAAANLGFTEQTVSVGNLTMTGGSAAGAFSRIRATNGDQRVNYSSITLNGGSAMGAFAKIDAANGTQRLEGSNLTLNAGNVAGPVANAGAIIEGRSQVVCLFSCFGTIMLNGRAGVAGEGNSSDALLRNLGGAQSINVNQISLNGGTQNSMVGILNLGGGTQTVVATSGIGLTGNAVGAGANADVFIRNTAATLQNISSGGAAGTVAVNNTGTGSVSLSSEGAQTITGNTGITVATAGGGDSRITAKAAQNLTANNGGITLDTASSGNATISSDATQRFTSRFVDVMTSAGSTGSSTINAGGNQWIRTTNGTTAPMGGGSIGVRALGSGMASIDSGARQLLEVDYFEVMTSTAAAAPPGTLVIGGTNGVSRIRAVDQHVFARSLMIQGGSAANATSKLTGTNSQAISVLDGVTNVFGGSGAGATAGIDPLTQTIVANNSSGGNAIAITGSTAAGGAGASITATDAQSIYATRGNLVLTANNGAALVQSTNGPQIVHASEGLDLRAGAAAGVTASIITAGAQTVGFGGLALVTGTAAGADAKIVSTAGTQTLTGGNIMLTANVANATLSAASTQTINAGDVTLTGGGTNAAARITTPGAQTISFGSLMLTGGTASGADAKIESTGGTQTLTGGNITLAANAANTTAMLQSAGAQAITAANVALNSGGVAGATTLITTPGTQTLNLTSLALNAGAGAGSFAQVHADGAQNITSGAITMTAGNASGAFVKIDTPGTQTLTGGGGNIMLTASSSAGATIEGHSQTISCGAACNIILAGNAGAAAHAQILNLSGAQTVSGGSISLFGGQSASTTAIRNQGTGDQVITASAGGITLESHVNASGAAVLLENVPATAQTITAAHDLTLVSEGGGTVAVTSGGTQSIDVRGLDVLTFPAAPGGANATVFAPGDQTIHTRGSLFAEPGVGMRVASLSTGTAKVESGGDQVINVDGNQLLIGRLALGLPGPGNSMSGNPAAGDSLVLATSLTTGPNQTVRAGSVYIQGPTNNLRVSKLSGDRRQIVTTTSGGLSIIGGAGMNAFASVDPTDQTIISFGDILLQGGSGPNADALINATGPQTVTSQNGSITLIGGTGLGADALIATTSPFQTISAGPPPNGIFLMQGPPLGGVAGFQQGSNLSAAQIAANSVTNEILREQDNLEDFRDDAASREGDGAASREGEEERRGRSRIELCS